MEAGIDKMLPCPFCGRNDMLHVSSVSHPKMGDDDPPPYLYSIAGCFGCNASVSCWGDKDAVLRDWNRRT